jgi:FkbM family methyltransferase
MSGTWESEFKYLENVDSRDVFILGRNRFAVLAAQYLDFEGFIDDETIENEFMGKKIQKFSHLTSKSFVLNCSTMRPLEARRKILSKTEHQLHVFTFLENCLQANKGDSYWSEFRLDYSENALEYLNFEASLKDQISISTWSQIKHIRLFGDFLNLDEFPVSHGKHYFPDFFEFNETGEVFYDIGCYDGETTLDFIEECGTFQKVYAFEPNPNNHELLRERFSEYRNIEIVRKGVSDSNNVSGFSSTKGSASHFDSDSKLKIELVTIDSLLIDPPTFIKMDIEGMERFALEGGRETISKYRPKLAISVYHLFDDVRVIFGLLTDLLPNSRFFLRHYSDGIHETVLFCIPD